MNALSQQIIHALTDITREEEKRLPQWIDKKFVADCVIPPLSGDNQAHCTIAVVAPVSAGKSTLFNALCGYPILPAASKTTSSVPTYITRVREQARECVTVYGIKKEVIQKDGGFTSTRFVRDTSSSKPYYAGDISSEMFGELFEYMYFVTHGTELEYKTTVENTAYFMKSPEKSDILFNGMDAQKQTITREDYALSYSIPRHRFLLLLILLCVYVNQNDSEENMSEYTRELNLRRTKLMEKYGFPVGSDYSVCLDWCSDDIPDHVTLIDLPGTGSFTADMAAQSSHTTLVRGILTEADAVWVLCSDNGLADTDLMVALRDAIEGNSRKNKVCIYNCKNRRPNDSGPVIDFLRKLPCLTGERCYVVDALAGEYKYTQNGIDALLTKTASDKRYNDGYEPSETEILRQLEGMYSGERKAYCTFTTSRDSLGNIIAVQDSSLRYTLDAFFKKALTDYIERLKYEVALSQTIEQAKFYMYIRDSLLSSRSILESIDGKGEEISRAVTESLVCAREQALDNYIRQMVRCQSELEKDLSTLGDTVGEKIKTQFLSSLDTLIDAIKEDWRALERQGDPNCLKANWFGNYPLNVDHPNWEKFKNVRSSAEEKITISAFEDALKIADAEIQKYSTLLSDYTASLRKVTHDFVSDYIHAFLVSFDGKRDELCHSEEDGITGQVYRNFNVTRGRLQDALESKLKALYEIVSDSFDVLTVSGGILDTLCRDTDRSFRNSFCENILDKIRSFLYDTFTGTNYIGWLRDCLRPEDLHTILNDDFLRRKNEFAEDLSRLIDTVYGRNVGEENFPSGLSAEVNKFNADKVIHGAVPQIQNMHSNIASLVSFGAGIVVDLSAQIRELYAALDIWTCIGEKYEDIYTILQDGDGENTKKLYNDCVEQLERIHTDCQK